MKRGYAASSREDVIWAITRKLGRARGTSWNSGLRQPSSSRARLVAGRDLDLAHRQRRAGGADPAEAVPPGLRRLQQVEVDLDVVDLLHAADVRVPPRLVRVDERARALDAGSGVDDLVAVHLAAAALHLVLRAERKLGRCLQRLFHA